MLYGYYHQKMPQTDNPVCGIFSINPMGISLPIPFAAHPSDALFL